MIELNLEIRSILNHEPESPAVSANVALVALILGKVAFGDNVEFVKIAAIGVVPSGINSSFSLSSNSADKNAMPRTPPTEIED